MKMFPVGCTADYSVRLRNEKKLPPCQKNVTWGLLENHEKQALENHCGQTLERLAERGGMCPEEILATIKGFKLFTPEFENITTEGAIVELDRLVKEYLRLTYNLSLL